ncbi:hypothetical protein SNK04_014192 [Fusarium graminearum]
MTILPSRTPESAEFARKYGIKVNTDAPEVSGQDWYFRNVVEDVGQGATEYWARPGADRNGWTNRGWASLRSRSPGSDGRQSCTTGRQRGN